MNTGDNTIIKMQDPIIISKSVPTNPEIMMDFVPFLLQMQ